MAQVRLLVKGELVIDVDSDLGLNEFIKNVKQLENVGEVFAELEKCSDAGLYINPDNLKIADAFLHESYTVLVKDDNGKVLYSND